MSSRNKEGRRQVGYRRFAVGAALSIWRFKTAAALLLAAAAVILNHFMFWMANSTGTAITTANLSRFLTWKTALLLLAGALLVFCYVVVEILSQICLCTDLITGSRTGTFRELWRGFRRLRLFFNGKGALTILFVFIAVPLTGVGFSISLTKNFYIPRFISSVIFANPLFTALYILMTLSFIYFAWRSVFCFHAVLIDRMSTADALRYSHSLVKEHTWDLIRRLIRLAVFTAAVWLAVLFLVRVLPEYLLEKAGSALPIGYDIPDGAELADLTELELSIVRYRLMSAFSVFLGSYIMFMVHSLLAGNFMLQLTRIYYIFTGREQKKYYVRTSKAKHIADVGSFAAVLFLVSLLSFGAGYKFEEIVRGDSPVLITAHRTGGRLASENSLEGIDAAAARGCYGSETDIQRTKDGDYIINHDDSFKRLTGVGKKPGSMTMEEISALRIRDTTGSGALLPVPTLDELLDRGKDKVTLFLELKGVSADRKMADDVVTRLRQREMTDQAVLISLKYDAIDYAETTYPDIETGLLIFSGIGDMSKLNCDMVIMEEEMTTPARILQIHSAGKKVGVWTVNTREALYHFLDSDADTVITDEIDLAQEVQKELDQRTDLQVIKDYAKELFE